MFRCIDGTQSAKSNADGQYIESLLDLTGFFFFFQHNVLSGKRQNGDKIPSRFFKAKWQFLVVTVSSLREFSLLNI